MKKIQGIALPETLKKYKEYLIAIKKPAMFNLSAFRNEWKIAHSLNIWLLKNNVIEIVGDGMYRWNNRSGIAESKLLNAYFEDYREYSHKQYRKRKAKQARMMKKANAILSVDKLMAKNFQQDIAKIKNTDARRQQEVWTDEDAINFLKQSPTYTYEIYRIRKEQL